MINHDFLEKCYVASKHGFRRLRIISHVLCGGEYKNRGKRRLLTLGNCAAMALLIAKCGEYDSHNKLFSLALTRGLRRWLGYCGIIALTVSC